MSHHPGLARDLVPADPVDRAERADLTDPAEADLVDPRPADPARARQVVRAELTGPADRAVPVARPDRRLAAPRPGDLVDQAEQGPVDLVDMNLAVRVAPAVLGPVARANRTDRADRAVLLVPADPADPVDPVDLVARVDLTDRVDPANLDRVDLADLVVPAGPDLMDPAGLADRHRRRMCSGASTTAVVRNSAVLETRRTASARPTTVLRHRPRSVGSAGTTGLLPGILRRTGTGHPQPVVGTVRRLPEVGTRRGTALAAI